MRKILVFVCFLSAVAFANFRLDSFQVYVDSMVPGSRYGLSIRSVKTGVEMGNVRGMEKFTPASTLKTLDDGGGFHYLPLDYEPKTEVSLNGSVPRKSVVGNGERAR